MLSFREPETQILDYLTQQHKLFIAIATAHAFRVTANKLSDTFNAVTEELGGGNLDRLPEVIIGHNFYGYV